MKQKLNCILLIDDDEPTNYLNKMILDSMQCACCVKVASSGAQAMKIIENNPPAPLAGTHCDPELIFLDINMPAMNGWEFLERYEANEPRKDVVIIMLTTSLNPDDKVMAEQSKQIKAFVSKPLTRERVQDIIDQYFIRNKN